ncbi:MAG TPA: hypothetical protein VK176_10020 [Phycisphaerales bacterium]|nr:hypothetical protein [Phycisphaerales bacterium]
MQVIDGATNCSYSICMVDEADFALIFPEPGQDIEFAEDLAKRLGDELAGKLVLRSTTKRIRKETAMGIHGTLFFELASKKQYYPNKRDADIVGPPFVN